MNLLITGGDGYLGKTLYENLKEKYHVTKISRRNFDLTNYLATKNFFNGKYFDVVIHCAINGGDRLIKDSPNFLDDNLKMYYNLLEFRENFDRFINFGSGAELLSIHTPYGLSKHVIRNSILSKNGFYTIRVFGVFDENELDSRFIKSNLKKYICKENLIIHKDRKMDFFYMKDLICLLEYYLENKNAPKEIDCTYKSSLTLLNIAEIINNLSSYQVKILQESYEKDINYIGNYTQLPLKFVGLEEGIKEVYQKLLCKK